MTLAEAALALKASLAANTNVLGVLGVERPDHLNVYVKAFDHGLPATSHGYPIRQQPMRF